MPVYVESDSLFVSRFSSIRNDVDVQSDCCMSGQLVRRLWAVCALLFILYILRDIPLSFKIGEWVLTPVGRGKEGQDGHRLGCVV